MWSEAAEATAGDGLTTAVFGLAGLVVTGVVGIVIALINRSARTTPSPPPASSGAATSDPDIKIRERIHTLEYRADARDQADEIRDHRVDQHEWVIDQLCQRIGIDPKWRHR